MRRFGLGFSISFVIAVFVAGGVPVFGDTGGTVPATVSVPASVCVTVDTTSINYGTKSFSNGAPVFADGLAGGVTSCSTQNQDLAVAGTDASGNLGASWELVNTGVCPGMGPDKFKHVIADPDVGFVNLTTSNQSLTTLSPSASTGALATQLVMPCAGSEGAGQTMSMSIVFTATLIP